MVLLHPERRPWVRQHGPSDGRHRFRPYRPCDVAPVGGAPNFLRRRRDHHGREHGRRLGRLVERDALRRGRHVRSWAADDGAWDTIGFADGAYDVCNVATDNALHTATATATVVVDNTAPLGAVVTPAAGTRRGRCDRRALDRAPPTPRPASETSSGAGRAPTRSLHNIGAAVLAAPCGRVWNTTTGGANQRPPDGPVTVSAVVTDNAGNALTIATPAVVDNTAPDVEAGRHGSACRCGQPDAELDARRTTPSASRATTCCAAPTVIGTVASIPGAPTFSFSDKSAPDQATSAYIVRAYDGPTTSSDSTTVSVLVDSRAVSAPRGAHCGDADGRGARAQLAGAAPPSPSVTTTSTATGCSSPRPRARRPRTPTPLRPRARTTTPCSRATRLPIRACSRARSRSSSTRRRPTSGGAPTAQVLGTGQVNLAWPAAGDALSGVAGYIVRRASGGTAPAAPDAGSAVCAPAQPGCADAAAGDGHLVVRRLRARRRRQRRADRHDRECRGRRQDSRRSRRPS